MGYGMNLELKDWVALCVKDSSDGAQSYYLFVQAYDSRAAWILAQRKLTLPRLKDVGFSGYV